jgi:adenylate cyclase
MLACYRSQDWDGAEAGILDCKAAGFEALDAFYGLYLKRIAAFRLSPPPIDWDGADTATSK